MKTGPKRRDPIARFFESVSPEPNTGCWLWAGPSQRTGHAQFHLGGHQGKKVMAYRFAYELFVGPIPDNLNACHKCDVPQCVNPDHIFIGSQKDNMADCANKGRTARYHAQKTHCKNGHPFEGDNLAVVGPNKRACRTCLRTASRRHYWNNNEAERARARALYQKQRTI